ncbi:Glutathione S-transferase A [Merluccius polli]|uniref:Glutathione S-transferase A n=1 Tax=Merluccius polli TaxID=89951 RepID=A0AA47MQI0_MERPO|nr:Glutathione S-transferase A [Merluccius polli]
MAKSMSLLLGSGCPPCWRVRITLEEKLQGYRRKMLSLQAGEHKSPEVLEINPRGQLPAFKHGDNVLNESMAACLYLENRYPSKGTRLIPQTAVEQALAYQRMFEGITLNDKLNALVYYEWFVPEEERCDNESPLKRRTEVLVAELQLWEKYLQKVEPGSYLAGSFSLADVTVFPSIAYAFRFGLSVERYPKLARYYSLLKGRASIKASWPPYWMESPRGYGVLRDL